MLEASLASKELSENEVSFFIENGFLAVRKAFEPEFSRNWWKPTRKWILENRSELEQELKTSHLHFPRRHSFSIKEEAPNLVSAIETLVNRNISEEEMEWGDGFVVAPPHQTKNSLANWHIDGFQQHYLDGASVNLVCVVLWTACTQESGGTAIQINSIKQVASVLCNHPEGIAHNFFDGHSCENSEKIYIEGEAGDVFLLHPFLLHARNRNCSGNWRAITNPSIPLHGKFNFDSRRAQLSPVELAITRVIGTQGQKYRRKPIVKKHLRESDSAVGLQRAWLKEKMQT